jgi:hypothetical protein
MNFNNFNLLNVGASESCRRWIHIAIQRRLRQSCSVILLTLGLLEFKHIAPNFGSVAEHYAFLT